VLAKTYEIPGIVPSGPLVREANAAGGCVRISFEYAAGLISRGPLRIAVAGTDRKFVWADARIDGETVLVSSPSVRHPALIRYGWADNPVCNLFNDAGLPASPFEIGIR
jgi:sialate O-acetylesterase